MAVKKDLVPVRILSGFPLEGISYTPGQLVGLPAGLAEQLAKSGSVDSHKDALAACKAEGFELIEHKAVGQDQEAEE
jgi:hypothetical protein